MSLMRDPDQPNDAYTAAHAVAGFQLADVVHQVNQIVAQSNTRRHLVDRHYARHLDLRQARGGTVQGGWFALGEPRDRTPQWTVAFMVVHCRFMQCWQREADLVPCSNLMNPTFVRYQRLISG